MTKEKNKIIKEEKKINKIVKNMVTINIICYWFAFMTGYLLVINSYMGSLFAGFGFYLTLMFKEKYKRFSK